MFASFFWLCDTQKNMLKAIALVALAVVLFATVAAYEFDPAKIEALFDAELGTDELLQKWKLTSIVISAVYDKSKIFSKGYGYANPLLKTPVSPKYSQYVVKKKIY